ncbi:hypothetical protein B6N60_03145 [Richelia sinica FACHB-800]|uniref:Uncharacterized protein n=1 Tax=Richelia sinica FACHB-800 TaxID=1357546 RepID=A0A975T9K8_9NOST|nr:hypothetical protein B6N60_03145 [Richelia sinica FACHB-800]
MSNQNTNNNNKRRRNYTRSPRRLQPPQNLGKPKTE